MAGTNYFTSISSVTDIALVDANGLAMLAKCNTTPETQANVYQVGCLMIRTDNASLYQNTGTSASPSWSVNGTGASGTSGATGASGTSGFSGKSGFSGTSGAGL